MHSNSRAEWLQQGLLPTKSELLTLWDFTEKAGHRRLCVDSGCSPISARRVDTPSLPPDLQAELLSGARLLRASPVEAAAPGPSPPPLGRERTALLSPSFTHILGHAPEYSHTPGRACQPFIFSEQHKNPIVQEVTLIHPLAELLLSTHSGPAQHSAPGREPAAHSLLSAALSSGHAEIPAPRSDNYL